MTAKHEKIAAHYRRAIEAGKLLPGQKMPSLRQIAKDRSCSINAATDAFKVLKREGMIITRSGSGTTVAPRTEIATPSGAARADRRASGGGNYLPGETSTGHTARMWECDDTDIATLLGIHPGTDVVIRQRQHRNAAGRVTWYNSSYTHARIAIDVPEILNAAPLHGGWPDMYHERTGRTLERGPQQYTARLATSEELDGLEIAGHGGGVPVLVKRVVWRDADGPVDVWEDVMSPGLWDLEKVTPGDKSVQQPK